MRSNFLSWTAYLILFLGCDAFDSSPTEPATRGQCLSCSATLDFGGIDGFRFGMPDADWLVEDCGFKIYGGHAGGFGDTLEMTGCGEGIYLHWRFNSLAQVDLDNGWGGRTAEGIRLGETLQRVLAEYPQATKCGAGESLKAVNGENAIVFDFDSGGAVEGIVAGRNSVEDPCLSRYKDD